ncbi:hypothetical protein GCM10010095_71650 [Streptomyces anthocyanicus]|nr:hypothetical protein GCM10010095_71650 [Streptomyces anthocyanicus]GHC33194.1 hypothetical protein GCM10010348_70150 [Streptomyces anthocyanicus]
MLVVHAPAPSVPGPLCRREYAHRLARERASLVGPTMGPTTVVQCACCRTVICGRGLWSSAWSGLTGGLTRMELVCVPGGLSRRVVVIRLQVFGGRMYRVRGEPR